MFDWLTGEHFHSDILALIFDLSEVIVHGALDEELGRM